MTTYEQVTGTGPEQLVRLQEFASRSWNWSSRWHPGELTWFWWEHGGPLPDWWVSTWRAGERWCTLTGHEGEIGSVVFSADGSGLFAAGEGSMLHKWTLHCPRPPCWALFR